MLAERWESDGPGWGITFPSFRVSRRGRDGGRLDRIA